jgi:adenylyltransferase/sulfurtransferase
VSRYSRQELFSGIGPEGQRRIREARVLLVGCGALGSCLAEMVVRAGVRALRVVDRDFVEESNLQRQSLFVEEDAAQGLPKAVAAAAALRRINSEVAIEGLVADFSGGDAGRLVREADLVLDGTDNFEARFLINDLCVRENVPWVYGACVGSYGLAMAIRPHVTPCLRCVLSEQPAPGTSPTCDTAGVVAPIVHAIAGIQGAEALKLLAGHPEALFPGMVSVDLWQGQFEVLDFAGRAPSCPACTEARFDYAQRAASAADALCGRDAVQVRPAPGAHVDLPALAGRLEGVGRVERNPYLVRFHAPECDLVVFADGRAIVKGVADAVRARSLYAKYVGA